MHRITHWVRDTIATYKALSRELDAHRAEQRTWPIATSATTAPDHETTHRLGECLHYDDTTHEGW